jgi:hypothetical protein
VDGNERWFPQFPVRLLQLTLRGAAKRLFSSSLVRAQTFSDNAWVSRIINPLVDGIDRFGPSESAEPCEKPHDPSRAADLAMGRTTYPLTA